MPFVQNITFSAKVSEIVVVEKGFAVPLIKTSKIWNSKSRNQYSLTIRDNASTLALLTDDVIRLWSEKKLESIKKVTRKRNELGSDGRSITPNQEMKGSNYHVERPFLLVNNLRIQEIFQLLNRNRRVRHWWRWKEKGRARFGNWYWG